MGCELSACWTARPRLSGCDSSSGTTLRATEAVRLTRILSRMALRSWQTLLLQNHHPFPTLTGATEQSGKQTRKPHLVKSYLFRLVHLTANGFKHPHEASVARSAHLELLRNAFQGAGNAQMLAGFHGGCILLFRCLPVQTYASIHSVSDCEHGEQA